MNIITKYNDIPQKKVLKNSIIATVMISLISIAGHFSDRKASDNTDGSISDVVKQCMKWLSISAQDMDPLIKMQHLALAKSYLNVARHIASDTVIEQTSRVHVRAISKRIDTEMQNITVLIHKQCPKMKPNVQLSKQTLPGDKERTKQVTWM